MFMGPCILVCNYHKNANEMQLLCSLFDSKTLHVSSVTRSSSGVQQTVFAARCRIQLFLIPSLCLSHAVSVKDFVGPGLVCNGCPLGGVRCELWRHSLTHRYNNSQIQHAVNWEIDSKTNEYSSWRYPFRSGGPPRKTQHTRSTT